MVIVTPLEKEWPSLRMVMSDILQSRGEIHNHFCDALSFYQAQVVGDRGKNKTNKHLLSTFNIPEEQAGHPMNIGPHLFFKMTSIMFFY